MLTQKQNIRWPIIGISAFLLGGCAGDYIDPDGPGYRQYIEQNIPLATAANIEQGEIRELSLEDAIDLGLARNLELRLAAYDTLAASQNLDLTRMEAFPGVQARASHVGRSNEGASSSRSVITGSESLEPSISTDQYRHTMELETSWNLLDVAMTVLRSKTASDQARIAAERQRKVAQDLTRDITIAYYQAWVAQQNLDRLNQLKADGITQLDHLGTAMDERLISGEIGVRKQEQLLDRIRQLTAKERDLAVADIELKTLLNLPPSTKLRLKDMDRIEDPVKNMPVASDDIAALEQYALMHRPELKEQILNKNIALRGKRQAVLETFPGAEFLLTFHYDSNQFLQDDRWVSTTSSLVQSITKLITLPQRYEASQTEEKMADERAKSAIALILAQVNISKRLVDLEAQNYTLVQNRGKAASRKAQIARIRAEDGLGTRENNIIAAMDAALVQTEQDLAYVELQSAYARLLNTLGRTTYFMRGEHIS